MKGLYQTILKLYMPDDIVESTPVEMINPSNPENYVKNLNDLYLGPKVEADLIAFKFSQKDVENFRKRCLQFLVVRNYIETDFKTVSTLKDGNLNTSDEFFIIKSKMFRVFFNNRIKVDKMLCEITFGTCEIYFGTPCILQ